MLPVKLKTHSSPYHNNIIASINGSNIKWEVSVGNKMNYDRKQQEYKVGVLRPHE